jgi:predicted site-specific integrase-resolvase
MNKYVTPKTMRDTFGISNNALKAWEANGSIKTIRTPGGKRLYDIDTFKYTTDKIETDVQIKKRICYCRVSTTEQKEDLELQIKSMQKLFPDATIISDIGSGINFKRKGLRSILEQASKGIISEVVVAHRDRLCRFAFELIEWILQIHGVKLVVLNQSLETIQPNSEYIEDILAIINVFNCGINGQRRHFSKNKNTEKQTQEINETDCQYVSENKNISESTDPPKTKIVVRLRQKNI